MAAEDAASRAGSWRVSRSASPGLSARRRRRWFVPGGSRCSASTPTTRGAASLAPPCRAASPWPPRPGHDGRCASSTCACRRAELDPADDGRRNGWAWYVQVVVRRLARNFPGAALGVDPGVLERSAARRRNVEFERPGRRRGQAPGTAREPSTAPSGGPSCARRGCRRYFGAIENGLTSASCRDLGCRDPRRQRRSHGDHGLPGRARQPVPVDVPAARRHDDARIGPSSWRQRRPCRQSGTGEGSFQPRGARPRALLECGLRAAAAPRRPWRGRWAAGRARGVARGVAAAPRIHGRRAAPRLAHFVAEDAGSRRRPPPCHGRRDAMMAVGGLAARRRALLENQVPRPRPRGGARLWRLWVHQFRCRFRRQCLGAGPPPTSRPGQGLGGGVSAPIPGKRPATVVRGPSRPGAHRNPGHRRSSGRSEWRREPVVRRGECHRGPW